MSGELSNTPTRGGVDDLDVPGLQLQVDNQDSQYDASLIAAAGKLNIPLDQINYVSPEILKEGKIIGQNGDYVLKRYLGHGVQGMVFLAENSEVGRCAVKVQNTANHEIASAFAEERRLIADMDVSLKKSDNKYPKSARPLRLIESLSNHGHDCVVLELLDSEQNLYQKPEKMGLGESDLAAILLQILTFLQIMHLEVSNVYKDQKLENYWWDREQRQLIVSDLGIFRSYTLEDSKTDFLRALRFVARFISSESTGTNEKDCLESESFHKLSELFKELYYDILTASRLEKMDTEIGTELLQKLSLVVKRWEEPINTLLEEATIAIEEVEQLTITDHDSHHLYRSKWANAADLLDISEKRAISANNQNRITECTRLRDKLFAAAPDYLLRELTSLSMDRMATARDSKDFQKRTIKDTSDYQVVWQFCNQEDVKTCVEQNQWNQLYGRFELVKPTHLSGLLSMVVDNDLIHSLPAWALQTYQVSTSESQFVSLMEIVSELLSLAVEVVGDRLANEADDLEKLKKVKSLIEKLVEQGDHRLKLLFKLAHPSLSDAGALSDRIAVLETKVKESVAPVSAVIVETGAVRRQQEVLDRASLHVHQNFLHADSILAVNSTKEGSDVFTEMGNLKELVVQKLDQKSSYNYDKAKLDVILQLCRSGSASYAVMEYGDFFQIPLSTHIWAAWSHNYYFYGQPFSTSEIIGLYNGYVALALADPNPNMNLEQFNAKQKASQAVLAESKNLQLIVKLVSDYQQLPAPVSFSAQQAEITQFDLIIETFNKLPHWLKDFLIITNFEIRSLLVRRRQMVGSVASEIKYRMGESVTDLESLYVQLESEKRHLHESLTYFQESEPSVVLLSRIYTAATTYFKRKSVQSSISTLTHVGNERSVEDDIHGLCDSLLRDQRPAYKVLRNNGSFFPDSQSPGLLTEWVREQVVIEVARLLLEQSESTLVTTTTEGDIRRLLEVIDRNLDDETELSELFTLPQLRLFVERFMQRTDFLQTYLTEKNGINRKVDAEFQVDEQAAVQEPRTLEEEREKLAEIGYAWLLDSALALGDMLWLCDKEAKKMWGRPLSELQTAFLRLPDSYKTRNIFSNLGYEADIDSVGDRDSQLPTEEHLPTGEQLTDKRWCEVVLSIHLPDMLTPRCFPNSSHKAGTWSEVIDQYFSGKTFADIAEIRSQLLHDYVLKKFNKLQPDVGDDYILFWETNIGDSTVPPLLTRIEKNNKYSELFNPASWPPEYDVEMLQAAISELEAYHQLIKQQHEFKSDTEVDDGFYRKYDLMELSYAANQLFDLFEKGENRIFPLYFTNLIDLLSERNADKVHTALADAEAVAAYEQAVESLDHKKREKEASELLKETEWQVFQDVKKALQNPELSKPEIRVQMERLVDFQHFGPAYCQIFALKEYSELVNNEALLFLHEHAHWDELMFITYDTYGDGVSDYFDNNIKRRAFELLTQDLEFATHSRWELVKWIGCFASLSISKDAVSLLVKNGKWFLLAELVSTIGSEDRIGVAGNKTIVEQVIKSIVEHEVGWKDLPHGPKYEFGQTELWQALARIILDTTIADSVKLYIVLQLNKHNLASVLEDPAIVRALERILPPHSPDTPHQESLPPLDLTQTLGDVLEDPDLFLSYAAQAPDWLAGHIADLGDTDEVGQLLDLTLGDEDFGNRFRDVLSDTANPLHQGGLNLLNQIKNRLKELATDPDDREEAEAMLEEIEGAWG